MTAAELAQRCADALEQGLKSVQLVVPRRSTGARRMVVIPKPRLYGEVCCETADGHTVVWVDAAALLALLAAAKLVKVEVAP